MSRLSVYSDTWSVTGTLAEHESVKRESSDDGDRYYDYEGKGADSVFNLDD